MVKCITFTNHDMQGKVYDFMINGYKVQEKVASNTRKGDIFPLDKNNSRGKNISYQKGDNDFYWINCQDKKRFYVIPEKVLIDHKYINQPKQCTLVINKISLEWLKEYKFN